MKQKNKGFTLIELIVTIAIIAIFSGVVLTVVGTGAHSYRTASSNAKVQMETQDVMDQIQNIIIDVNRSVYYTYGDAMNSSVGDLVSNDIDSNGDASGTAMSKTFMACSGKESSDSAGSEDQGYDYSCDIIMWNKQEQKLYYACRTWKGTESVKNGTTDDSGVDSGADENGTPTVNESSANGTSAGAGSETEVLDITDSDMEVADATSDGENMGTTVSTRTSEIQNKVDKTVLAENITDFRVDVSKVVSERIIRFQFTADVNGKETTTVHTVNLRNQIQISKPEDGYGKSDGDTPWILLTNYPTEIEPGKSVTGFSKLMNGNIDPDTVKWVVESGKGVFTAGITGAEDSAVTLKASDDAQDGDTITIHVEARTTDGKTVTSKSGIIKVVNKKVPVGLVPNSEQLLLGIGNSYELSDLIKWKIKYSDESQKELSENQGVAWELENLPEDNGISLEKTKGKITIPRNNLGTDTSNSAFSIKATIQTSDKTLTGTVTVKLARIDILSSKDEYNVSELKPQYEYKEGGVVKNPSNLVFNCTHNNEKVELGTYKTADNFVQGDVGNWTLNVSVKVGEKNVSDQKNFTVKSKPIECEMGGRDIIIAGQPYLCSYWTHNNFHPEFALKQHQTWKFEITWQVTGESDPNTAFPGGVKSIVNNDVNLTIGSQEHGFVLEAFVKVFDRDTTVVAETYHASKNIRVITQSDVIMENPIDTETNQAVENYTVIKGRSYTRPWSVYVWQYNPSTEEHSRTKLESLTEKNITWDYAEGWNDEAKVWTVPLKTNINSLTLIMHVTISDKEEDSALGGKNIMPPNNWYKFDIPKTINITDPETTIELLDDNKQKSSEIYPDDTIKLTAYTKENGKDFQPDHWRWKWECLDMDTKQLVNGVLSTVNNNLNNQFIFTVPSMSNQTTEKHYKITASFALYDNDIVERKASYMVTVKPYTVTAEIMAVNNKTSVFPGDTTQLYLRLKTEKGIMDGTATWTPENWNQLSFNGRSNSQESIYDGKEIPITVAANNSVSQVTEASISVNYTLKSRFSYQGSVSTKLTITPLTLILASSSDQIYYGDDNSVDISADIVDAENDQHVTDEDGYSIEWSLSPALNEIYELNSTVGAKVQLMMKKAPDKSIPVTVTAVAKKSENIVCTASKIITVNPKTTIEKAYNCPAGLEQKLEFNSEHQKKEIQSIKTSYLTSTGNEPIECKQDDLKILTFDSENMKVQMNSSAENFASYKYAKISADLGDVLYNFYIYPVQNNVYDYELNKGSGTAIAYVPTDIDSIRKLCSLDNDGYTYTYARTDKKNKNFELRFSVYSKTGIGSFNGNYIDSSANKWFMRRQDNTNDWVFYRLEGNRWYRFHNGDRNEQDLKKKAQITRFYWRLNSKTHLFDDKGNETTEVSNSYFWKKWK